MEYVNGLGLLALGSRLRALSDRLYAIADEVYAGHGSALQGRWFPLLRLLHDRGPCSVGEIAEAIGQSHSAVSQLADRMVRDGWLHARVDRSDRRLRRLGLTDKAAAALRDAKPAWRAIQQTLESRCADAGIDVLATLGAFGQVLDPSLVAQIAARTQALQRDQVRVVGFDPALREHFYRLNAAWLRKYFYLEEIDHRVLSRPEDEILAGGGEVLFALLGDDVVGTCALMRESDGVYELTKMAVDERYQGLGTGRRLIEAAIDAFRARRGTTLFLETNSRLAPAVRLYESVGFERQPQPKPDSHYQRSDVYMIWRGADAPAAPAAPVARRRAATKAPVRKAAPVATSKRRAAPVATRTAKPSSGRNSKPAPSKPRRASTNAAPAATPRSGKPRA